MCVSGNGNGNGNGNVNNGTGSGKLRLEKSETVHCISNISGNCDSGWSYFGGYCYSVVNLPISNMNDGHKYCVQQGGDLASVLSIEERNFVGQQ